MKIEQTPKSTGDNLASCLSISILGELEQPPAHKERAASKGRKRITRDARVSHPPLFTTYLLRRTGRRNIRFSNKNEGL